MRQSWETMTSVSAGHIIMTPTPPVGSGWPQRESNPGPPHQELRALPTELRRPLLLLLLPPPLLLRLLFLYILLHNIMHLEWKETSNTVTFFRQLQCLIRKKNHNRRSYLLEPESKKKGIIHVYIWPSFHYSFNRI